MKQFHEQSQQDMREIWQVIATLLARKSSHNTQINIFKDALLTTRKVHSLMERCISWILLNGFLIWKSILIFGRFMMIKKYGLHLINWTMKKWNGGKTFKSIKTVKVSIQSALGKE